MKIASLIFAVRATRSLAEVGGIVAGCNDAFQCHADATSLLQHPQLKKTEQAETGFGSISETQTLDSDIRDYLSLRKLDALKTTAEDLADIRDYVPLRKLGALKTSNTENLAVVVDESCQHAMTGCTGFCYQAPKQYATDCLLGMTGPKVHAPAARVLLRKPTFADAKSCHDIGFVAMMDPDFFYGDNGVGLYMTPTLNVMTSFLGHAQKSPEFTNIMKFVEGIGKSWRDANPDCA